MDIKHYFAIILLTSQNYVYADTNSDAHLDLKFGGWSKHYPTEEHLDIPLNENHNGFGLEYYKSYSENNRHFVGFGGWYMKDSFDGNAYQASLLYKYRLPVNYVINSLDFNMNVGLIYRTLINNHFVLEYNRDAGKYVEKFDHHTFSRELKVTSTPYISINFTENLHADISYLPESIAEYAGGYELYFIRFGYRINF